MAKEVFSLVLNRKLEELLNDEFRKYMHEEFYKLMFNRIPFLTGNLSATMNVPWKLREWLSRGEAMQRGLNSGHISPESIWFTADYAVKQYYKHATMSQWAAKTFESDKGALVKRLEEYLNRRGSK